jgi:putative transposase
MPWSLKRFQESHNLHFLNFSCYKRRPNFAGTRERLVFEAALERVRQHYDMCVYGYVVMPEHVHMLVNEPEREICEGDAIAQTVRGKEIGTTC